MGGIGIDVPRGSAVAGGDERARDGLEDSVDGLGRGKMKLSGFKENFERNEGLRTLKYMLKDRNALFA